MSIEIYYRVGVSKILDREAKFTGNLVIFLLITDLRPEKITKNEHNSTFFKKYFSKKKSKPTQPFFKIFETQTM